MADLLYALGWALWTGAVVVVFVQIFPEARWRQIMRGLDAHEAAMRNTARAGSDQASRDGRLRREQEPSPQNDEAPGDTGS